MHSSPLRYSIISIVTDLGRKINIVTKQNALFNEKLNFLTNFRSVQINLHKGVIFLLVPTIFITAVSYEINNLNRSKQKN